MLLLVDEWFHVADLSECHHRYRVKPIKLEKKYDSLSAALTNVKPGWLTKQLPLKPYRPDEEVAFFSGLAEDDREIVYFYEPRYTSANVLDRLRSWLLPDRKLFPIPVQGNRAEALYLMHVVSAWFERQEHPIAYRDVLAFTNRAKSRLEYWMLTPEPKKMVSWRHLNAVHRSSKGGIYSLIECPPDRKIKLHGSASFHDLWHKLLQRKNTDRIVWTVCKGAPQLEEMPGTVQQYHLQEPVLPVNIPFVQVVIAPDHGTPHTHLMEDAANG